MKRFILPLFLLLLPAAAFAQQGNSVTPPASNAKTSANEGKPVTAKAPFDLPPEKKNPVRIPHFQTPPVIDGKLDEEIWKQAATFKDFFQTNPGDNIAPSRDSVVLIGYDSKHLYIAIHAYDEPDKVRATLCKRDEVFGDDNFRVFLDTFNDQRRAYVLGFNPFGIQGDGIMTEGSGTDFNVDIVMESKGSIVEDGWVCEVAIPFKSLRYEAGEGKLWGIHVWRNIDRFNDEIDSWMPISRDKVGLLNQAGKITGLEGIDTERQIEVIPSLTLSESGKRVATIPFSSSISDPGRIVNAPLKSDAGVTVKMGITPTLTLDLAVNPDFAQVEADYLVITANQRFPIFFPEKRPFFLEGVDIFRTNIQAVNTRTIVDPDYAVKLTGKQGRTVFGVLLASDNAPGNYSDEERNNPELRPAIERFLDKNAYVGVLRVKRDVGKESNFGFLATTYNFIEKHNHVAGFDGRFRIDTQTTFSFQILGANSRRFFRDIEADQSIYRTGNGVGYSWNYNKSGRHFGYNLSGGGRTADYRSDVGFLFRTDTHSNNVNFRYNSEPKPKATLISWNIFNGASMSYDGKGRSQGAGYFGDANFQLKNKTYLNWYYEIFYNRIFEEEFGTRRNATRSGAFFGAPERSLTGKFTGFNANFNPTQKYNYGANFGRGWNSFDYDFGAGERYPRVSPAALLDPFAPLDPGAASSWNASVYGSYRPVAALETSMEYSRSSLKRNDTRRTVFVSNITSFFTKYQFTRFTFVRARLDYDTLSSRVRGQYLFGWTPNPGTAFYVGYNDSFNYNGFSPFNSLPEPGFRLQNRTFFIKTSYLFRRSI